MEDINKIIAKNLLKLRKNAKLTQMELAEKFNYSDKSISKWEKGESMPSVEVLSELAEFYGISLDSLTKEGDILNQDEESDRTKPVKEQKEKVFPVRPIITLLSVSAVWILATIAFAVIKIVANINYGLVFLWAVPISCILLVVFTAIWCKKRRFMFISISALLWSAIVCIHVQLLKFHLWPLYVVGIPVQIAIILWAAAMMKKKPKNKDNLEQEKSKE